MPRPNRSQDDLNQSATHLKYEVEMLFWSAHTVPDSSDKNGHITIWVVQNALIESFVIHFRNLVSFLYDGNRPTNVRPVSADTLLAEDFFNSPLEWHRIQPQKTSFLALANQRAHEEIAHLTISRNKVTELQKNWDKRRAVVEIFRVLKAFTDNAPTGNLPETLVETVNHLVKQIPELNNGE